MEFQATNAVSRFKCLQDQCPDTCCKGWSMQLDAPTFQKYAGTELEQAVAYDGEIRVMRRDPGTDYCVKFTDGVCGIHKDYGAGMLGDACYFYPRVTRKYGSRVLMTATLSCPEIARLMLEGDDGAGFVWNEAQRFPNSMRDSADVEISVDDVVKVHQAFLAACESADAAATVMARIYSAAGSLARIGKADWRDAAGFMLKMADGKLPAAEVDAEDAKRVLQVFAAVIHATGKRPGVRLMEVIGGIERYLGVEVDWATLELIIPSSSGSPRGARGSREEDASSKRPPSSPNGQLEDDGVMKKYIASQLSFSFFPFAGIGETIADKAKLLCYKFALTKIALAASTNEDAIKTIQSIARIIDHIADPTLVFNLMRQFGWERDARMVGLLN